jgi:hypothetical protein
MEVVGYMQQSVMGVAQGDSKQQEQGRGFAWGHRLGRGVEQGQDVEDRNSC